MESQKIILLFDGICNLCNGLVQFVIKRDKKKKFVFASMQSEVGQKLLKQFNQPITHFDSFVFIKDQQLVLKSTASLFIFKELGGLWSVLYLFIIIPVSIRDAIYNLIAKRRYQIFGKRESCMIPTPDLKERFLD